MRNPWARRIAPRATRALARAVTPAPSVQLRQRRARGESVAYLSHAGNQARARRLARMVREGRGWFCTRCRELHGFDVPAVIDGDTKRCDRGLLSR